jgi:TolB-like protein/tetratricopeptide (TPR) repeat protein
MIYTFEDFSLDTDRQELFRGKDRIAVEPQVFDLLHYLVRNRHRVVSKDDLIAAVWKGRIISESTLTSRITAVRHAIADRAENQRLLRTIARKGLRFIGEVREERNSAAPVIAAQMPSETQADPARSLALPDSPSIAVLPFNNLSGDPEQEYFADGIVEDIITALSRIKWFFVIARNSSFTYKGKNVDVKQVARELGVRYVLEGSVRKVGNKVRITGQLIDGSNAVHIWADTFDGVLDDIFDLQDRITASVVSAIEPSLQHAEFERLKYKPTDKFDAYDLMLHALQQWHQFTEASFQAALDCLDRAIVIDPSYAPALAMAAYCYAHRRQQGWAKDIEAEASKGLRLASKAVDLAKDDGNVLWMAAAAVWQLELNRQRARELARRSVAANGNSVWGLIVTALIEMTSGNSAEGLSLLQRANRLSPRDPTGWLLAGGMSLAYYLEGKFDDSIQWSQKALAQNPRYVVAIRLLAANYARLEQPDKAMERVQQLLKGEPALTISKQRSRMMFMDEKVWNKLADGLRLAGLPD